jgi:hypothetical protein
MKAMKIMLMKITRTTARELTASPRNICPDILASVLHGKSVTSRAAIVAGSRRADGPSGSAAINEVNLSVAAPPGNRANLAASCQGSTSKRANAERTLIGIPFLSSPTGANRKSLNSDPSWGMDAECIIWHTELPAPAVRNPAVLLLHGLDQT